MASDRQPAQKFKLGFLELTIWGNEHNGTIYYKTTCHKNYQDADGNWQKGQQFDPDDLPVLSELFRFATGWILQLQRKA